MQLQSYIIVVHFTECASGATSLNLTDFKNKDSHGTQISTRILSKVQHTYTATHTHKREEGREHAEQVTTNITQTETGQKKAYN